MSGPGRPRIYDRAAIAEAFASYIENTEIPILAEFAANQGFGKQVLYDFADSETDGELFSYLVKKCLTKKESALERQGLAGKIALPMAIFSLKQMGWTDKQDTTLKGDRDAPIQIADASKNW